MYIFNGKNISAPLTPGSRCRLKVKEKSQTYIHVNFKQRVFVGIITSSISIGTSERGKTNLVPDSIVHGCFLRRSVIFSDLA